MKKILMVILLTLSTSFLFASYSNPMAGVEEVEWWNLSSHKGTRKDPIPMRDGYAQFEYDNAIWQMGISGTIRGSQADLFRILSSGYKDFLPEAENRKEWCFVWCYGTVIKDLNKDDSLHDITPLLDFNMVNSKYRSSLLNSNYLNSLTEAFDGGCYEDGEMQGFLTLEPFKNERIYLVIGKTWFDLGTNSTVDFMKDSKGVIIL